MNGVTGNDEWFHSFLEIGSVLEIKSESKIDNQTDKWGVQIPLVFFRTLSPSGPLPC